jgi:NAD dependent epimerase/dehydratase family enzyme
LGSGQQWWSWIHRTDLVRLIQFALEQPVHGPLNAVAPAPVTQRDFSRALAQAVGRREFLPAPAFALKLALGGFSWELLSSKRCQPEAALQAGFTFTYEALEPALQDLVSGPR